MMVSKRGSFLTAGCLVLVGNAALSSRAVADVVTDWNAIATAATAVAPATERPAFGLQNAIVQVAIYDAVNAIDRGHRAFGVRPVAPTAGASQEAAAASAGYQTLLGLYPSQAATLAAAYDNSLLAIADGPAKARGIAVGAEVAAKWLAKRANDGRMAAFSYSFGPTDPGVFQMYPGWPAPGGVPIGPITPWLAKVTPFVLRKASQYRVEGPPELDSRQYAADYRETQRLGVLGSVERTAEQTALGKFHTMNPNLFWGNNLNRLVKDKGFTVAENARLLAQLWVSIGDAAIACWDSKYAFNSWRPVTAIRYPDDGNAATVQDPAWLPQEATPPHPEYPAAHGCVSGAVMEALRQYFGTKHLQMTFTSTATVVPGGPPVTLTYQHTEDFLEDVADARVFGGMHFRSAVEDGEALGKRVAKAVAKGSFESND